jgi:uncharacterized protein (DUF934 family)
MKFIDPARDPWQLDDGPRRLLALAQWTELRASWPLDVPAGIVIDNDADVEALEPDLPRIALVVLQFPKWTDGRAYSQARLLRTRLRFAGEIRAAGEVLVDMLPLLQRTGFDAVQLRADQSLQSAQRALRFFAGHYQGDTVEPRPLFRREPNQGASHVGH